MTTGRINQVSVVTTSQSPAGRQRCDAMHPRNIACVIVRPSQIQSIGSMLGGWCTSNLLATAVPNHLVALIASP